MSATACPSELVLDRYQLDELRNKEAATLRAHLEACPHCAAKLADRERDFAAIATDERDAMIRNIHATIPREAPDLRARERRSWLPRRFAYAVAGACAVILAVVAVPRDDEIDGGDTVQPKGRLGLEVFRERNGSVHRAISGETFRKGDRLRFTVDVPEGGNIMIVGFEASGGAYAAYPLRESGARSVPAPTDKADPLPGAVALDDAEGTEWLHLVWCPEPFKHEDVKRHPEASRVDVPAGCAATGFEIVKGPQ